MTVEEYFGMIINMLMGITLIVLLMLFLYMIFGEREREKTSAVQAFALNVFRVLSDFILRLQVFL